MYDNLKYYWALSLKNHSLFIHLVRKVNCIIIEELIKTFNANESIIHYNYSDNIGL